MGKTIFVDIDNTICQTEGIDYENAKPMEARIAIVNRWYDQGNIIVYWTARGALQKGCFRDLTEQQLKVWGCKYHELRLDKPLFDEFYDDRAFNSWTMK